MIKFLSQMFANKPVEEECPLEELFPAPDWDYHARVRNDLPGRPFEITVERHVSNPDPDVPVVYVAYAYSPKDVRPTFERAKSMLIGAKPPQKVLAPALQRI